MVFSSPNMLPLWWKNVQNRHNCDGGITQRGKGIETAFFMQVINHLA